MARHPVLDPSGLARAAERLSTVAPGYGGYRSAERRLHDDRSIRRAASRQLGMSLGRLDRARKSAGSELLPDENRALQKLILSLARHRDRIQFAPQGDATMLSREELGDSDLDGLVSLDAGLWAALEALDRLAGIWDQESRRPGGAWPGQDLFNVFCELEEVLDERESFLRS